MEKLVAKIRPTPREAIAGDSIELCNALDLIGGQRSTDLGLDMNASVSDGISLSSDFLSTPRTQRLKEVIKGSVALVKPLILEVRSASKALVFIANILFFGWRREENMGACASQTLRDIDDRARKSSL